MTPMTPTEPSALAEKVEVLAEASVNEIPDAELLRRAVRNARGSYRQIRWAVISGTFCLGSTFSAELCRRYGVDPHEMVPARRKPR